MANRLTARVSEMSVRSAFRSFGTVQTPLPDGPKRPEGRYFVPDSSTHDMRLPPGRLLYEYSHLSRHGFEGPAHFGRTPDSACCTRVTDESPGYDVGEIRVHIVTALLFFAWRKNFKLDCLICAAGIRNYGDSLIVCECCLSPLITRRPYAEGFDLHIGLRLSI